MAQLVSISLNDETAELVEKLKAKNINISKAFCTAPPNEKLPHDKIGYYITYKDCFP